MRSSTILRAAERIALFGSLLLAALPTHAATVDLYAPRAFGYFIGDAIAHEAIITLDPGFRLEASALPRPRGLTYWLDLTAATLEELPGRDGARRYRLALTYQTFYAPLEPRALEIPAVPLVARDGNQTLALTVPGWTFVASPLREVVASRGTNPMALRPDIAPPLHPVAADIRHAGLAAGLAAIGLLGLAAVNGWGPFGRHRPPFAAALRRITRRGKPGEGDEPRYAAALIDLHRAFDAAAGRRLLADDLPAFLAAAPQFQDDAQGIASFFAASRIAFFGAGPQAAMAALPPPTLTTLARRLASAERKGGRSAAVLQAAA